MWSNAVGAALNVMSVLLVLVLIIVSGSTTYAGLRFFAPWMLSGALAVAVQFMIVMSTFQFARAYWRANHWRLVVAGTALIVSTVVSVFFSYFSFNQASEATRLRAEKFAAIRAEAERFATGVQAIKSQQVTALKTEGAEARTHALQALGGRLPNGDRIPRGLGPVAQGYSDAAARAEAKLATLQGETVAERQSSAVLELVLKAGPDGLVNPDTFAAVDTQVASATTSAASFASAAGATAPAAAVFPSHSDYVRVTPSLASLTKVNWLSLFLATMVDVFAIVLTYWFERSPFGQIDEKDRHRLIADLLKFSRWSLNTNDQLEVSLTLSEQERVKGVSLVKPHFAAGNLLNSGHLRRVSATAAEFTPRLYALVNEHFTAQSSGKGSDHG